MILSEITLHQFRSHHEATFQLDPHITLIHGKNGAGKTNILEAIYALLAGKSFRDSDESLIEFEQKWWRVEGVLDGVMRDIRYNPPQQRSKQVHIDGAAKGRFTYRQQLPVVLFEPDDLLMIHSSPSTRRSYIDELVLSLYPPYRQTLAKYERSLLQRNNLLKNKSLSSAQRKDSLFVWDVSLSESGAEVMQRRAEMINKLNETLSGTYSQIANKPQTLQLVYESKGHQPPTSSTLLQELHSALPHDLTRGITTVGPHRDDIDFVLNGESAKHTASRGEVRSIILALKLTCSALLELHYDTAPIILLDDVFSELDAERQATLLSLVKGNQIIVTNTNKSSGSRYARIAL